VVSGLRIQNSPQFHMKFDGCDGVLIEKLSISSPKLSPNTDGIHIENTKAVGIYDSMISNGRAIILSLARTQFGYCMHALLYYVLDVIMQFDLNR
jgi:hypothetical protein